MGPRENLEPSAQRTSPPGGTVRPTPHVQHAVDAEEAQAVRAEGLDPDDPAVVAAKDMVRWELSLLVGSAPHDPEQ
jgi:hypothetical protein